MERAMGGSEKLVGKFLNGMYGGRTERGRPFMTPEKGVDLQVLKEGEVGMTPLLDEEVSFFLVFILLSLLLLRDVEDDVQGIWC